MSRLAGKFAGILIANVDSRMLQTLTRSLNELESSGLRVIVETDQDESTAQSGQQVIGTHFDVETSSGKTTATVVEKPFFDPNKKIAVT
jgi:glycine cleavage system regulatory protein